MATFVKGVTDRFGPIQLYKPDYGFLTKVLGTKQAQWERGFQHVKSAYNSILNGPLTNENNKAQREEAFKKLQASLKSASNLDLSDAGNVQRALKMVDPIAEDEEIAYDMAVTRIHQQEKAKMERYKNSDDPDERALYSDYSAMGIQMAEQDLRDAKRGTGDIQKVRPGEFVPYEDINAYLNKQAKDAGLEISIDHHSGGYIVTDKNGEQAAPYFQAWAAQQMGTRFDRQLRHMGKIQAETAIRSKMKNEGLSRSDATKAVASTIIPQVAQETSQDGAELQDALDMIQGELEIYRKTYGNSGIPANMPKIKAKYDELVQQEALYKKAVSNAQHNTHKLNQDGVNHLASNLESYYTRKAKADTALKWGGLRAETTKKHELKSDATYIANKRMAFSEMIHQDNLDHKDKRLLLDKQRLALDIMKASQATKKAAKEEGDPYEDIIGLVTSPELRTAVQGLQEARELNNNKMYKGLTRVGDGLMNLVADPKTRNATRIALNNIKIAADGGNAKFSASDKELIKEYAKRVGYPNLNLDNIQNRNTASLILEALTTGTFKEATNMLKMHANADAIPDEIKDLSAFKETLKAMKGNDSKKRTIDRSMAQVAELITDDAGRIKPEFEGAKQIGRTADGKAVFDLRGMTESAKLRVDKVIDKEFHNTRTPVTEMYKFHNLTPGEWTAIFNNNIARAYNESGEEVNPADIVLNGKRLADLPHETLSKMFAGDMDVVYHAVGEKARLKLKVDPSSSIAKTLEVGVNTIEVEIPYATIRANQRSLGRLGKYMRRNTVNPETAGEFAPFVNNPMSRIVSPDYINALGINYDIAGGWGSDANGNETYGLETIMNYYDPTTDQNVSVSNFTPISNPDDPTAFNHAEDWIWGKVMEYLAQRKQAKAQKIEESRGNTIPLNAPSQ